MAETYIDCLDTTIYNSGVMCPQPSMQIKTLVFGTLIGQFSACEGICMGGPKIPCQFKRRQCRMSLS